MLIRCCLNAEVERHAHSNRVGRCIIYVCGFQVFEELTKVLKGGIEGILLAHIYSHNLVVLIALQQQVAELALKVLLILAKEWDNNRDRWLILKYLLAGCLLELSNNIAATDVDNLHDE